MSPCVPLQIVIASIMCSYNKEDWTELAKMAEVKLLLWKQHQLDIPAKYCKTTFFMATLFCN